MDVSAIPPYTVPLNQPQNLPVERPTVPQELPPPEGGSSGTTPPVPENIPKFDFYA